MEEASRQHIEDISRNGYISHIYQNVDLKEQIEKLGGGKVIAAYGQSLQFYFDEPEDIMMQLLIDDTGYTQGNFENIFDEDFNEISCFTSKHNQYRNVTSIAYVGAIDT